MSFRILTALLVCASMTGSAQTFFRHSKTFKVGPNPSSIVAADLTGDGLPEIVTADIGRLDNPREEVPAHDQVSLLVARGDMAYQPQPQLKTGFAPWSIALANMDALKAPDIVVGCFLATRNRDISLFRNVGEGLFESRDFSVPDSDLVYTQERDGDDHPVFTTPGITSVAVADFNNDGFRDVIATGWSSDVLIFFPGNEETILGEPLLTPAARGPRDLAVQDFDGDGNADLAVALYNSHEIGLWKGDGQGHFEEAARFPSRVRLPQQIRAADINGDGQMDLVVSQWFTDDAIALFFGDGAFKFSVSQMITLGDDPHKLEHEIRDILVTDFDGNGRPDIAAACFASHRVTIMLNTSSDTRAPQAFRTENYTFPESGPRALCAADFNQDGKLDIAVTLWSTNSVGLLLAR